MFLKDVDVFVQEAQSLFLEHPGRTRYVARYNHKQAKLVVKVTDDRTVLQYRTDQQTDVKKLDELQAAMLLLMAGVPNDNLATLKEHEQTQAVAASPARSRRSKRRN